MSTASEIPAPGRSRRNRGSAAVRDAFVRAAISEFAARGFEGASTRRIAEAAGAHQSQIKYHFSTKDDLWKRCLDHLIAELDEAIESALSERGDEPIDIIEGMIRGVVQFAAWRPELNRIMMHEATSPSHRLSWLVETHTRQRQTAAVALWDQLREDGVAAPIESEALYHTMLGAASLLYANAPEARLFGIDPSDSAVIRRHEESLVATLLPGLRR